MNKKKILQVVGIVLLIVITIFLIHTIRNYVIIRDLQNKFAKYEESNNYHIKSIANSNDGTTNTKMNYYKKDNKQFVCIERNSNGEVVKLSMYDNGERTNTFVESNEGKSANLNNKTSVFVNLYNYLETDNKWQTILGCITAKIKSVDYNGKKCYVVKDFMSSTSLSFEGAETYIDKETGLFIKTTEADIINEREYEFNNVSDDIFIEPDISQYTLKENN